MQISNPLRTPLIFADIPSSNRPYAMLAPTSNFAIIYKMIVLLIYLYVRICILYSDKGCVYIWWFTLEILH